MTSQYEEHIAAFWMILFLFIFISIFNDGYISSAISYRIEIDFFLGFR